jgi:hypothetical protein
MSGTKHDKAKAPVELVPVELICGAASAFGYGVKKYGRFNYREGIEHTRLAAAVMRHILAYLDGENYDSESGLLHLSHAAASLGMLMWHDNNRPDLDDRWRANNEES